MMQLISMLIMTGIVFVGALYLFQVIIGKRKAGNYDNIAEISGFGAMLIIMYGTVFLFKEFMDKQTIKEYPMLSILGACVIIWVSCRLFVFGKEDQAENKPHKFENNVDTKKDDIKINTLVSDEHEHVERLRQIEQEPNKTKFVEKQQQIFSDTDRSKLFSQQRIGKFIIQNGIATDTETDLTWCRFALGQVWQKNTIQGVATNYIWKKEERLFTDFLGKAKADKETAFEALNKFNQNDGYAGFSDWRLPSIDELKTLIGKDKASFSAHKKRGGTGSNYIGYHIIDADIFPNNNFTFWSSSPDTHSKNHAWVVDFGHGTSYCGVKVSNELAVRLVRGGRR